MELALFDASEARRKQKKAQPAKPRVAEEGVRVRATDGTIGRTVAEGRRGYFKLQLPNGMINDRKAYKADELTPTAFDPDANLPPGFAAVTAASFVGMHTEVLWNDGDLPV